MKKFLCIFLLSLFPMIAHAAGRVFYDGFEDGTTNKWSQDDYHNKCAAVSSALDGVTGPHSGTRMARCNWNGVVPWDDPEAFEALGLFTWNYSTEMFMRFWIREDTDVDHVVGAKMWRMAAQENSLGGVKNEEGASATLYMAWDAGDGSPLAPTYWGAGCPILGDNRWHKYEFYFLEGNGNGIIRVWVDDTQIYNVTNAISERWYPFHLMSNWSNNPGWEHDANNHVYWDDFEIYSDTGTGATGSMSDATISGGSVGPPPTPAPVSVPPGVNQWFSLGTGIGFSANARIGDQCPPNFFNGDYYPFHDSCKYVTIAWSSGFLDPDQNIHYFTGGGHNNYNGNEVYALDLKSLTLIRTYPSISPTTPSAPDGSPPPFLDCIGTPCVSNSKHNYNGILWMNKQKKAFLIGGSPARQGNFSNTIWTYDPYAGSPSAGWQRKTSDFTSLSGSGNTTIIGIRPHGNGSIFATTYDPISGFVYFFDYYNLFSYDDSTNTIRSLTSRPDSINIGGTVYYSMLYDPKRKVIALTGGVGGRLYTFDVSGGPTAQVPGAGDASLVDHTSSVPASATAFISSSAPGWIYDPDMDRWNGWGSCSNSDGSGCPNGANVNIFFSFNPDKVLANDSSMVTLIPTTGGQSSDIEVGSGNLGVNGRLRYSPKSRLYTYCGDIFQNCLAIRLSAPDDTLTVKDTSGGLQTNRPVSINRGFRQGDIPNCPQAWIGGVAQQTQADVKSRWADGSVKTAQVSWIVPSLSSGGTQAVTFLNQSICNNDGFLAQSDMLAGGFNFDVKEQLVGSSTVSASARAMLNAGAWRYYLQGPIVTGVIIEDRSSSLTYDMNPNGTGKTMHPIYDCRFYPSNNWVECGAILENDWVSTTQANSTHDETFTYSITRGNSSPVAQAVNWAGATSETFSTHPFTGMSRSHIWFCVSNCPGSVLIDHNLNYLASSGLIENFDTSIALDPTYVGYRKSGWTSSNKTIQGSFSGAQFIGLWERQGSDGGGGHPWIGIHPTWDIQYLYWMSHFDQTMEDMFYGNADLHGRLQIHNRERDNPAGRGLYYDQAYSSSQTQAFGRPLSISARKEVSTQDYSDSCSGSIGADKINTGAVTIEWTSYSPRYAPHHAPNASYLQWLLSGRYFYQEEAQFDASYYLAWAHGCVDTSTSPGGSRQGDKGYFIGGASNEIRGLAWTMRSLIMADIVSPDGSPERSYYDWYLKQNKAILEGTTNNPNSDSAHLPAWTYAQNFQLPSDGGSPTGEFMRYLDDGGCGTNCPGDPLREDGTPSRNVQNCNGAGFTCAVAPWMEHFLVASMGFANDAGIDFSSLLQFRSLYDIGLVIPGSAPTLGDRYRMPGKTERSYCPGAPSTQGWWPSWACYLQYGNPINNFSTGTGSDQQYEYITNGAFSFLGQTNSYGINGADGFLAYQGALNSALTSAGHSLAQHFNGSLANPNDADTDSPKWATLPRVQGSSVAVIPPPPPPTPNPPSQVTVH